MDDDGIGGRGLYEKGVGTRSFVLSRRRILNDEWATKLPEEHLPELNFLYGKNDVICFPCGSSEEEDLSELEKSAKVPFEKTTGFEPSETESEMEIREIEDIKHGWTLPKRRNQYLDDYFIGKMIQFDEEGLSRCFPVYPGNPDILSRVKGFSKKSPARLAGKFLAKQIQDMGFGDIGIEVFSYQTMAKQYIDRPAELVTRYAVKLNLKDVSDDVKESLDIALTKIARSYK